MQTRLSNLLAMSLMLAIGAGFLTWYYVHAAGRPRRALQGIQSNSSGRAEGEMPLPSLGQLRAPAPAVSPMALAASNLEATSPVTAIGANLPEHNSSLQPTAQSPKPTALERRLSGVAFSMSATATPSGAGTSPAVEGLASALGTHPSPSGAPAPDPLSALLKSVEAPVASARILRSQRLLLPKGAFIDCTLETAIDTTLPGITSCVTATDTFSADGTVVLLERGTKLMGETRGQVQRASSRVFVLWNEARTPTGVIVPLDSPGADELGRSGLPGEVERHFLARFGAAILVSTIEGGMQAAVQSTNKGNGAVIYGPSGPQDVLGEVLKDTMNIQPTVIKRNGDRIQVLVARDVDFSSVYELRRAIAHP